LCHVRAAAHESKAADVADAAAASTSSIMVRPVQEALLWLLPVREALL
jgi:hypothetical protein